MSVLVQTSNIRCKKLFGKKRHNNTVWPPTSWIGYNPIFRDFVRTESKIKESLIHRNLLQDHKTQSFDSDVHFPCFIQAKPYQAILVKKGELWHISLTFASLGTLFIGLALLRVSETTLLNWVNYAHCPQQSLLSDSACFLNCSCRPCSMPCCNNC